MSGRLVMAAAICATLATACGFGVCTKSLVSALGVRVTDASTDAGICDATVDASDGEFMARLEILDTDPATCTYFGAPERRGTYRIVVQHAGYKTATVENVVVTGDHCHVMPQQTDVALQPGP